MSRQDRFKEMGKHTIPDHRLLPKAIRDTVANLPREERRRRDRLIKKSYRVASQHMHADSDSGAGYPIDKQLREFLLEYNERQLAHGLMTMPSSFNVFEGFLEFHVVYPVHYFAIRSEKDHLFSLGDFLGFVTSADSQAYDMRSLFELQEGIIYNFTPVGDVRELAFLHADSSRFVIGGFTMVRREEQLHWAMVGGPICDLAEKTRDLLADPITKMAGHKPPEKAFVNISPTLEHRAEPLAGTDDVWKTVVFGRFNLHNAKHEVRYVGHDHGNAYRFTMDDPEALKPGDTNRLTEHERLMLDMAMEGLEAERLLFEIAETCFRLPAYFAFRITLIRETKRETAIAALSNVERFRIAEVSADKRPLFRTVAALDVIDIGRQPVIRSYAPPQYKVEVDGFWRRLDPTALGKDALGNPVKGRTWVKGHLRWRARPEREATVFVKSSIAAAKAKAAAIAASDSTATILGDWVPPIYPVEIEPDTVTSGWLYVMRCPLMDDDIYKVGWTSRVPKVRADELSAATGVPSAYIVVETWEVDDGRHTEGTVHIALSAYRINPRREFFKASFAKIRAAIVQVISLPPTGAGVAW
jgi:hypothetical protein